MHRQHPRRLCPGDAEDDVLLDVVPEDEVGDVVGHVGEQDVALLVRQIAVTGDAVEQNLDVHLVVGGVDARRVVDGVGVDPATGAVGAVPGVLDAAALTEAEVAAFAHNAGAQLDAVHADGVVRLVGDLGVALGCGLDVGADAAVPEQVNRRDEDRPDELGRGQ